jgi:hypothetical protein
VPLDVSDDVHLGERLVDERRPAERGVQLAVALLAVVELLVRDEDDVDVEARRLLTNPRSFLLTHW